MAISQALRDAHRHFWDRPEWAKPIEWQEIRDDNCWARAYLPYDDEPLRTTGESLCRVERTAMKNYATLLSRMF